MEQRKVASPVFRRFHRKDIGNKESKNSVRLSVRQSLKDFKIRIPINIPGAVSHELCNDGAENTELSYISNVAILPSRDRVVNSMQPKRDKKIENTEPKTDTKLKNTEPKTDTKLKNTEPKADTKLKNTKPRNARSFVNQECDEKPPKRERKTESFNLSDRTRKKEIKSKITDVFHPILMYGTFLGLPVSHVLASKRKVENILVKMLSNLWIVLTTFLNTVCITIMCIYVKYFFTSTATRIGYCIHCLCGLALMWIFVLRRRKITATMSNIFRVSSELRSRVVHKEQRIYVYLALICVHAALLAYLNIKFLFFDYWDASIQNVKKHVLFQKDSVFYPYYNWFAIFSMVYPHNLSTLVHYFASLFCGEAYRSLGLLVSAYGNELTTTMNGRSFRASSAGEIVAQFRRVFGCIGMVEETLGICCAVIHADIFIIVFGSVSIFFSGDVRFQSFEVFAYGTLFSMLGLVMLVYLAYSGEKVAEEGRRLKRKLIGLSDSLFKQSPGVSDLEVFTSLSNDIKNKKYNVTLLGFFDINKSFVLSFFEFLVSYIVSLYQLGTIDNS